MSSEGAEEGRGRERERDTERERRDMIVSAR